ncbi:hypothetical protein DXG03_009239 [Asterophora parasitica]|uniref:Uncharacterized protein n=1 Tax=Asterophora parasitica TaxID=117018 RepID=A0A9P7KCC9_9AGAR|nr:hypothetical protein DXG03_009239 [Asterophora parasitica]
MASNIIPEPRSSLNGDDVDERNVDTDGTFHQAQLGLKANRKHFFAPIDSAYANAVHRDAATVGYTEEEEKRVKRKIDKTVLPLVVCRSVGKFEQDILF